jgi:hypothetical protein
MYSLFYQASIIVFAKNVLFVEKQAPLIFFNGLKFSLPTFNYFLIESSSVEKLQNLFIYGWGEVDHKFETWDSNSCHTFLTTAKKSGAVKDFLK